MSYYDIIAILRWRWKVGLLAFCVVIITGMVLYFIRPVNYEAKVTLAVEQPSQDIFAIADGGAIPARYLSLYTRASRIHTLSFARRIKESLVKENPNHVITEEEIFHNLHLSNQESPDLFTLTFEHQNPDTGSKIVEITARLFIEERMKLARREAKGARELLEERINELEKGGPLYKDRSFITALKVKLEELKLIETTRPSDVVLLDEVPKIERLKLNLSQQIWVLIGFGILMGIVTMLVVDRADPRVIRLGGLKSILINMPCWNFPAVVSDKIKSNMLSVFQAVKFWEAAPSKFTEQQGKVLLVAGLSPDIETVTAAQVLYQTLDYYEKNNKSHHITQLSLSSNCDGRQDELDKLRANFDLVILEVSKQNWIAAYSIGRDADGVCLVLEAGKLTCGEVVDELSRWRSMNVPVLGLALLQKSFPAAGNSSKQQGRFP